MGDINNQLLANFSASLSASISNQISLALNNITINMPVYNITNSLTQVNTTVQSITNNILQTQIAQNNFNTAIHLTQAAQNDVTNAVQETEQAQENLTNIAEDNVQAVEEQVSRWEQIKQHIAQASQMAMKLGSIGLDIGKKALAGAAEDDNMRRQFVVATGSGTKGTEIFEKFKDNALSKGIDPTASLKGALDFMKVPASSDQTEKLNNLAAKLSTLSGTSYDDAVQAILSGMDGDTKPLNSKFGISESGMDKTKLGEQGESGNFDGYIASLDSLMAKQGLTQSAFETMLDSPTNKWTQLTNNYGNALSTVGTTALAALTPALDALNTAFASDQFQVIIQALSVGFTVVANIVAFLVQGLLYLTSVIQEHWNIVAPILAAIAFVFLVAMIVQLGIIAAEWLMITWPILLVIGVIALVIYILQQMGFTGAEMMGMLIGAVYAVGEYYRIVFMSILALVATVVNFFVTLWYDAIFKVQQFFYDFKMSFLQSLYFMISGIENFANGFTGTLSDAFNAIIDGINTVLPYFNKIFGTNWGRIDLLHGTDFHSASDGVKKMMSELEQKAPERKVDQWAMQVPAVNPDFAGAYNAGNKKGQSMANGLTKATDSLANYSGTAITQPKTPKGATTKPPEVAVPSMTAGSSYNPSTNAFTGGNSPTNVSTVDHVNKVGNIEGTVDISSEDLKMMRDLAELQAIQNFVSLTPTVQVTTGDINSGADLDTIVGHIGRKLEEEFVSTAQGVYI